MHRRKIENFLYIDRKILYITLGIVLISIFSLTIIYAALSTTLNINSQAEVSSASWDIHLDNVVLNSSSATTIAPSITDSRTATFTTTLSKPGDFYAFTIDVVNNGSIDAMIDSVTKTPELSANQKKYLNYIVEYQNGESITTKQLVAKKSFVRLKVKLEFRKDITSSDLPTSSETLSLSFTVNYVQSDDTGNNVVDNGMIKVATADGDINDIGTIITIGSEQFYTIGTEGNNVKLLSMYNLYVGNECTSASTSSCTPYGEEATGMQDSNMLGNIDGQSIRKGTTAFSNDSQKGKNYADYNGSIVEKYVNNYKKLLEINYELQVVEARLITKTELTEPDTFSCVKGSFCSSAYPWIYSTSYFTSTKENSDSVWRISRYSGFSFGDCIAPGIFGVRPVIVISKSNFK